MANTKGYNYKEVLSLALVILAIVAAFASNVNIIALIITSVLTAFMFIEAASVAFMPRELLEMYLESRKQESEPIAYHTSVSLIVDSLWFIGTIYSGFYIGAIAIIAHTIALKIYLPKIGVEQ